MQHLRVISSRRGASPLSREEKIAQSRRFALPLGGKVSTKGSEPKVPAGPSASLKRKPSPEKTPDVKKAKPTPVTPPASVSGSPVIASASSKSVVPVVETTSTGPSPVVGGDTEFPSPSCAVSSMMLMDGLRLAFARIVLPPDVAHPSDGVGPSHFCVSDGVFQIIDDVEYQAVMQTCLLSSAQFCRRCVQR